MHLEELRFHTLKELHRCSWHTKSGRAFSEKDKYEALNALSRFIITMQTFHRSTEPLIPAPYAPSNASVYDKLSSEMVEKNLVLDRDAVDTVIRGFFTKVARITFDESFSAKVEKLGDTARFTLNSMDPITCPIAVLNRLKERYRGNDFDKAATHVVYRYSAMEAWSMNWSLDDALKRRYAFDVELFGSPFNVLAPRFGTLFPDTDALFGGVGSYREFLPTLNTEEVKNVLINPPYIEVIMADLGCRLHTLRKFRCVVSLPTWRDSEGWIKFCDLVQPTTCTDYVDNFKGGKRFVKTSLFDYTPPGFSEERGGGGRGRRSRSRSPHGQREEPRRRAPEGGDSRARSRSRSPKRRSRSRSPTRERTQ